MPRTDLPYGAICSNTAFDFRNNLSWRKGIGGQGGQDRRWRRSGIFIVFYLFLCLVECGLDRLAGSYPPDGLGQAVHYLNIFLSIHRTERDLAADLREDCPWILPAKIWIR